MTQEQANRILVEKGEGGCWHEWKGKFDNYQWMYICNKCKLKRTEHEINYQQQDNPNFSEWQNFGRLLKIANNMKWGKSVIKLILKMEYTSDGVIMRWGDGNGESLHNIDNIPSLIAEKLAEILEEEEGE